MSDPTNPKQVRWRAANKPVLVADTLATIIRDEESDTVELVFGQTVGTIIMETVSIVVQRDVAEAFGGSLLSLGNKPRPGE